MIKTKTLKALFVLLVIASCKTSKYPFHYDVKLNTNRVRSFFVKDTISSIENKIKLNSLKVGVYDFDGDLFFTPVTISFIRENDTIQKVIENGKGLFEFKGSKYKFEIFYNFRSKTSGTIDFSKAKNLYLACYLDVDYPNKIFVNSTKPLNSKQISVIVKNFMINSETKSKIEGIKYIISIEI